MCVLMRASGCACVRVGKPALIFVYAYHIYQHVMLGSTKMLLEMGHVLSVQLAALQHPQAETHQLTACAWLVMVAVGLMVVQVCS